MELVLGTEPRTEYRSFEAAAAARKLIEQIMLVRPGETVVITADTASDMRVVRATAEAAFVAGAHPIVLQYETRPRPGLEPPAPVAAAVKAADVWIEFSVAYTIYTAAHRAAIDAGCRFNVLTAMDVDMLLRTIGNVDIPRMLELGERLTAVFSNTDRITMRSEAGTDISGTMKGRRVKHQGKVADKKGETVTLAGQVTFMPIEESLNGTIVIDGTIWPPDEVGLLREPVRLVVQDGIVRKIEGGREARLTESYLRSLDDPNMFCLSHLSLGLNPGVRRLTGRILEDERLFGCVTVGLGSQGPNHGGRGIKAAGHQDGIVSRPTFVLDGQTVEQDGRYTHPDLAAVCREMRMPGY
jgi:leucyl aminopeptidase (aminopeptidase T)